MFTEVTDMQASFNSVNGAVETQAAQGAQVLKTLEAIRGITEQVRIGSEEIQSESGRIHKTVEDLKGVSEKLHESVVDVQKACGDIAASLATAQKIAEGKYLSAPDGVA
jgi:methyl-accepting chemotaxis protein